ncbi:MAG: hypothetical protein IPQ01_19245 [Zoogloea sp.]|nr:hypothetical protein [Zoogloea sp.]
MISALAVSPVAEIATLPAPADQSAAVARLGLADVSLTARHGCKGPGTVAWLQDLGLPIPPEPNSWLPLDGGGRIARLGFTEFLIEGPDALIAPLVSAPRAAGVYPVLRQDAAYLSGALPTSCCARPATPSGPSTWPPAGHAHARWPGSA